jgi:hypothetical protein
MQQHFPRNHHMWISRSIEAVWLDALWHFIVNVLGSLFRSWRCFKMQKRKKITFERLICERSTHFPITHLAHRVRGKHRQTALGIE